MNFQLLWLDTLCILLLWVIFWCAVTAHMDRKWLRRALLAMLILVPTTAATLLVLVTAMLRFRAGFPNSSFGASLALLIIYLIGTVLIVSRAAVHEAGEAPAAVAWPRAGTGVGWLLLVVVGYIALENRDAAVRAHCALIGNRVYSLCLSELPPVASDGRNAAPLFQRALARLADDSTADINNPPYGAAERFQPDEPATIAYLKRQAGTVDLLRRAVALPCRFEDDLMGLHFPDTAGLSRDLDAMNLLDLDARERAARGDLSGALNDADTILKMSRRLGMRPALIHALMGLGLEDGGLRLLERLLPRVTRDEELVSISIDRISSPGDMLELGLLGEEFQDLNKLDPVFPPSQVNAGLSTSIFTSEHPLGMIFRSFVFDADSYLQLMHRLESMARRPWYEGKDQLREDRVSIATEGFPASIIYPVLESAFQVCAKTEALESCARIAIAATRYRLRHGSLPSRLEDLVPKYLDSVPLDPFDGKPIRFKIRNNQPIVYSVGPNGIDDGGVETDDTRKGDLVFHLTAAPEPVTRPN